MEVNGIQTGRPWWCHFEDAPLKLIPKEIWLKIFKGFEETDFRSLQKSCRTFRDLLKDHPFTRWGATGHALKHGKCKYLTNPNINSSILHAEGNEIFLNVMYRLVKYSRKDGKVDIEDFQNSFDPKSELRLKDYSFFFGRDRIYYYRRDKPLSTMVQLTLDLPTYYLDCFVSGDRFNLVYRNNLDQTVGVKQYIINENNELSIDKDFNCGNLENRIGSWSSDEGEFYCWTRNGLYRLVKESSCFVKCGIPNYTGILTFVKGIDNRMFLLSDHKLYCWSRTEDNANRFEQQWCCENITFDRIERVLLHHQKLYIDIGEYRVDDETERFLCIIDVNTGKLLYNFDACDSWDVRGATLVRCYNHKFTVMNVKTGILLYSDLKLPGNIHSIKIQQDNGAILILSRKYMCDDRYIYNVITEMSLHEVSSELTQCKF
jgi:hypothetical protein